MSYLEAVEEGKLENCISMLVLSASQVHLVSLGQQLTQLSELFYTVSMEQSKMYNS